MYVIFSAKEKELNGLIEYRFGRCPVLVKVDSETEEWEAFDNPGMSQSGGAGIAAAQFVIDQNAEVVVSGDFGPNAANTFKAANIKMLLYPEDVVTVKQAFEHFQQDKLKKFS